ncbi:MAG: hypothetical protein D6760_05325 [Deltaproteobacteria bacterium]|nr:MAG: hypothetical protein D6760_05325 [Deltaproteobacteria bacterium]
MVPGRGYRTAAALLLIGACIAAAACSKPAAPACPGCNVVLISADTLRADHVGAYGYPRPVTPNIDRLAEGGVLFENAISQSSWTRPAHLSIMTGLYPAEHGVIALKDRRRLPDDVPTLAGVLAEHGYRTAAFTGGVNVSAAFGFDQGFQEYRSNGKYFRDNLEDTRYWLDQHAGERFFLWWHGYDPHTPYLTDPIDRKALGLPDQPPRKGLRKACASRAAEHRIRNYLAEYDGAIHRADRYIGKLLDELDRRGLRDHTLIVFTSDHGEEFVEHGGCFHLNTLYEEVLRVPLIFSAPGLAPRRVHALIPASVSIAPTILELVGIREHPLPGPSLAAAVLGGEPSEMPIVSETMRSTQFEKGHGHLRSLRLGSMKLIDWITLGRRELYDLRSDPSEHKPITEGPALAEASSELERWLAEHPRAIEGSGSSVCKEEQRRIDEEMKSLGYLN